MYPMGLGSTLLGAFRKNTETNKDPRILPANTKNIEALRAIAILNNIPDMFVNYKLSNVKVLSYMNAQAELVNTEDVVHNFNELYKIVTHKNSIDIENNFTNSSIQFAEPFEEFYKEIMFLLSTSNNKAISSLAKGARYDLVENKLEELTKLHRKLESLDSTLQKNPEKIPNFKDNIEYAYYLISLGVAYYSGIKFSFDYNIPRYGIKLSDAGHMLQTILFSEGREYDKKGNKVVGFLGGSYFNTTDAMVSDDMTQLNDFISLAHQKVRDAYSAVQNKIVAYTNKYYDEIGRSGVEKFLIGKANVLHEVFFEPYENSNKISDNFRLKDPYDLSNDLNNPQREYLKAIT